MTYENDIPLSEGKAAHYGTSFFPEKRAEQRRREYSDTLTNDRQSLDQLADTDEKKTALEQEFARYRSGYRARYLVCLRAASRTISPMITGPARFPVERNRKRCDTEMKRWKELADFRERALKSIRRELCPELRPIMAGDGNATERLQDKIAQAERLQEQMKAINTAHKDYLKNPASLDASALPGDAKAFIRNYKPAYSWEPHPYPPYALTNNNANIRRMKERLGQVSAAQATPASERKGELATMEDCPADNRVRLFFPGKPSAEIRENLKRNGFRWAPSIGCWQAYRNHRTIELAKQQIGAVTS